MVRAADERGHNKYLQWRSMKKDFLIEFHRAQTTPSDDGEQAWQQLRKLMLFTWKNLDEIQEDKRVIDNRDPYRDDGNFTFRLR